MEDIIFKHPNNFMMDGKWWKWNQDKSSFQNGLKKIYLLAQR